MRHLLVVLVGLALSGCDLATGGADVPVLSGTWEGVAGGDTLRLYVSEQGTNVTGIADWGGEPYTIEGRHRHPDVQLALTGPFTQTTVVDLKGSLVDSLTIRGTLGTFGLPDQPVTLQRTGEAAQ
jgi:hypothetical protein